jgi:hypothetical protein
MFMLSAYSFNAISKRFVGTISDYKIINSNMDWVVTSNGTEYIIEHTDDLFIGDSVFEYWVNYNKRYFGTQSCSQFINIIDRK